MKSQERRTCPICEKNAADDKLAPFCSKRCADVDLSRWLKGSYVIPGTSLEVTDQAPPDLSNSKDDY